MTHHNNLPLDPGEEPRDAATAALLTDLHTAYSTIPPAELCRAMDRSLYARMASAPSAAPERCVTRRLPARPRLGGMRLRAASLAAALLLALSAMAGYLRPNGVAPVSAQALLQRAASALGPSQAAHFVYDVTLTPGSEKAGSLTADVWVQTDASATPALSAQTLATSMGGQADSSRSVQIGQQTYAYDAGHQAILIAPLASSDPSWLIPTGVLDGAGIAQAIAALQQRSPQSVQLLPAQTLNGVPVDVIQVDGWTDRPAQRTTFYFDAQSYLLRGFDAVSSDPSYPTPAWQARLSSFAAMPAVSVPAQTFALHAPPTAHIEVRSPDLSVFATTCHNSADAERAVKTGKQSLLAACQATAPTITVDSLVAALIAPFQSVLNGALAAGQITAPQEATAIAAQQQWLRAYITSPGGGTANSRQ